MKTLFAIMMVAAMTTTIAEAGPRKRRPIIDPIYCAGSWDCPKASPTASSARAGEAVAAGAASSRSTQIIRGVR